MAIRMTFLSLRSFSRLNYISNFILLSSPDHIVDADPALQCTMDFNWRVGYLFGGLRNSSVLNIHSLKIWVVHLLVYIFISIFSFLLGRCLLRISPNISQGTKEGGGGEIKVMFSLSDWASPWSCKVWLLFYMVVDNVRPILIQNTNGNLHWWSHNPLALFCFFFAENNSNILVTQGGGGGGFYMVLNGEAPSQGPTCSNCISFLNP